MLKMVIENPRQFTMVRAVPLVSGKAFRATMVEKRGESPMTTIPQNKRNTKNKTGGAVNKNRGERRQQAQESPKARAAILRVPKGPDK